MPHDIALEATVTSKGRITIPKSLRERMGLKWGSRIRFRVDAHGRLQGVLVLHDVEDLWAMADEAGRPKRAITKGRDGHGQGTEALVIVRLVGCGVALSRRALSFEVLP